MSGRRVSNQFLASYTFLGYFDVLRTEFKYIQHFQILLGYIFSVFSSILEHNFAILLDFAHFYSDVC